MVKYIAFSDVQKFFEGKKVAIVGSAPSCRDNEPGFIDSFDIVCRINNFKLFEETGYRTDVYYSYFGRAIRIEKSELKDTRLVMCKYPMGGIKHLVEWGNYTPNSRGVDYEWVYEERKDWWFGNTYIPTMEAFVKYFNQLGHHIPTTGFSCILDVSQCDCEIYLTGFDFFESGKHNVNETWIKGDPNDPIRHRPDLEKQWLSENKDRFILDERLSVLV